MELNYSAMGTRIKNARTEQKLTQERLAEMADISCAFLGHIERGTRKMSLETFSKLCSVLSVSADCILLDSYQSESDIIKGIAALTANKSPDKVKPFLRSVRVLAENIDNL